MNYFLYPNENFEFEIEKTKSFPFLNSDWLFLFFFLFIGFIINMEIDRLENFSQNNYSLIVPIIFIIFVLILFLINLHKRYIIAYKWKYLITNQRLIVINHKNKIEKDFSFENFPKLKYEENVFNSGIIIIGETKKSKEYPYRNFESISFDLYNVKDIRKIYTFLSEKINKQN